MRSVKSVKKNRVRIVSFALIFALMLAAMPQLPVQAKTAEERLKEAQQALSNLQEEKNKLDSERSSVKDKLAGLNFQQNTLKQQIEDLNTELQAVVDELENLNTQITTKEQEIEQTQQDLVVAKENEASQYLAMEARVKYLYENPGAMNYVEMFLSADSFGQLLNMTEYMNMVAEYDNNMFDEYQRLRMETEQTELKLQAEHAELLVLKQESLNEQTRVNGLIEEANLKMQEYISKVSTAKQEIKNLENEMAAKQAEMAEQQADIEQIKREIELSKLAAQSKKRDVSEIVFDPNDRYLLANLIYCEAGGEPYEGQLAVGAVVINRVRSTVYPDTVSAVIYQRRQFAPVDDGHLALALAQNKATPSCYKAADEAMAGMSNVGDCVYFRTILPHIQGTIIGNHIFY